MPVPCVAVCVDMRAVTFQVGHNVLLPRACGKAERELPVVHHRALLEERAIRTGTHVCAVLDQELDLHGSGRGKKETTT